MDELRQTARVLLRRGDLGLMDLWIEYWNHGGRCQPFDFDAFLYGMVPMMAWLNTGAFEAAVRELALEGTA